MKNCQELLGRIEERCVYNFFDNLVGLCKNRNKSVPDVAVLLDLMMCKYRQNAYKGIVHDAIAPPPLMLASGICVTQKGGSDDNDLVDMLLTPSTAYNTLLKCNIHAANAGTASERQAMRRQINNWTHQLVFNLINILLTNHLQAIIDCQLSMSSFEPSEINAELYFKLEPCCRIFADLISCAYRYHCIKDNYNSGICMLEEKERLGEIDEEASNLQPAIIIGRLISANDFLTRYTSRVKSYLAEMNEGKGTEKSFVDIAQISYIQEVFRQMGRSKELTGEQECKSKEQEVVSPKALAETTNACELQDSDFSGDFGSKECKSKEQEADDIDHNDDFRRFYGIPLKAGYENGLFGTMSDLFVEEDIPRDGSCVYHCAISALDLKNVSVEDLRNIVADELVKNTDRYAAFIVDEGRERAALRIRGRAWGDELEISIIEHIYKRPIAIFERSGRLSRCGRIDKEMITLDSTGKILYPVPVFFLHCSKRTHYCVLHQQCIPGASSTAHVDGSSSNNSPAAASSSSPAKAPMNTAREDDCDDDASTDSSHRSGTNFMGDFDSSSGDDECNQVAKQQPAKKKVGKRNAKVGTKAKRGHSGLPSKTTATNSLPSRDARAKRRARSRSPEGSDLPSWRKTARLDSTSSGAGLNLAELRSCLVDMLSGGPSSVCKSVSCYPLVSKDPSVNEAQALNVRMYKHFKEVLNFRGNSSCKDMHASLIEFLHSYIDSLPLSIYNSFEESEDRNSRGTKVFVPLDPCHEEFDVSKALHSDVYRVLSPLQDKIRYWLTCWLATNSEAFESFQFKDWTFIGSKEGDQTQQLHCDYAVGDDSSQWHVHFVEAIKEAKSSFSVIVALEDDTCIRVLRNTKNGYAVRIVRMKMGDILLMMGTLFHGGSSYQCKKARLHVHLEVVGMVKSSDLLFLNQDSGLKESEELPLGQQASEDVLFCNKSLKQYNPLAPEVSYS